MDYSHAAYFQAPHQPYHFIGMPPLTPSHSASGPSEDYNTTSPPEVFGDYTSDQFANFDAGFAQFSQPPHHPHRLDPHAQTTQPQTQTFPGGPLTPPNAAAVVVRGAAVGRALNGAPIAPAPHVVGSQHPAAAAILAPKSELLEEQMHNRRGGSNSEEDEMTPAQSKRKAQNRAAQRAFRERKEKHVKDLEARLASLQAAQEAAASENERLKRDLQKMSTENEILRATGGGNSGSPGSNNGSTTTGPLTYNPTDFYSDVMSGHSNKGHPHRIVTSDEGERLYAAGATWDFIISHELFQKGLVDIADISHRLKPHARCDGQGPVFEENVILEAIKNSVASGSDTLI